MPSDEKKEFAIGDTVQVISGGPAMTVQGISLLAGEYQCVWFNGCIRQQGTFEASVLKEWVPPTEDGEDDELSKYLDDPVWTPPK